MADIDVLSRLEARVAALLDRDAIEALKARYWNAVDRKRPDDVAACLAADVVVDFEGVPRCEGRDAFMAIVRQAATRPAAWDMHHGHNPRITLTGPDTAAGEWDIFYYGIDVSTGTLVQMSGVYHDTYRREEGRRDEGRRDEGRREQGSWLISTTEMRIVSLVVQTAHPGAAARVVSIGTK